LKQESPYWKRRRAKYKLNSMTSAISRGKITFHPASCAAEFSASLFEHYAIRCCPAASIFVAIIQACQPCSGLAAAPRKGISLEKQPWESERNLGTALASTGLGACPRSEERRVGKECR